MGQIFDSIEQALDGALRLPHVAGDLVDKFDIKDAFEIITNASEAEINKRVIVASTLQALQAMPVSNKVAFCNESNMLYRYKADVSMYVQSGNAVIVSNTSGGWVEHDSYNKIFVASQSISLEHANQSSVYTLSADTEFSAVPNLPIHNGHTHAMRMYCNGHTPTFTGFEFMANSSPLELDTIDTSEGYYHTVVFFKLADVNRFILLDKVASADVEPPVVSVSVASINDTTVSFTVNTTEPAELKWALYAGGSTSKTTSDIDAGTGAIVHGTKALLTGNNTLSISSLTELTTYDLWQYAADTVPNASAPAKTIIETSAAGMIQLTAPVLSTVSVIDTISLSVPIASSSIDANAESVSLFYKRSLDSVFTEVNEIIPSSETYSIVGLEPNTAYDIYLKAIGDGVIYSDSPNSNIFTQTTQNIAPTLGIPYTSSDGITIELPFSRAMADPAAQTGLFSVSGGKIVSSVALKSGDATKIQVNVNSAYLSGDAITVTLASGVTPADNGIIYGGVTNKIVTNNVVATLSYPTGYVALHSADQSVVDLSAKTVSDLSDNNRGLSLFSETTPASDGGVLANGNKSILFPAGTAFKFPSFVCNNVNGFAFACVFTFAGTNSSCGFANSPHNWCGKLGVSVQMSSGSKFSTIAAPSGYPIVAFVVGLENNSGVIKVKQYAYNLTTNNIITNDVGTAVTFSSITKDFGIGEINYNGAVNYAGATKWQHSIFYERSLNDTEFSALCAKIVNDYKV